MARKYADKLAYVIKNAPASRQIRDPFDALYTTGLAIEPPLPPERLLLLAEENAIHAACLRAKADDAVGRGWKVVGGEDAEPADEVAERLRQITPDWTFAELLSAAAWELEAIGWAAWEIVREGDEIAAIYPMPAHTLRATKDPTRFLQIRGGMQREFVAFGEAHEPDISEVILFRIYSPRSPYYGVPRWISAIPAMAELTAIREYNISFFASGGTADRIITVSAPSLSEARKVSGEIHDTLRNSSGHAHVSIVVPMSKDAAVDVQFLSPQIGRREGQFLRRREDLVKEVLMAHGVPPYRIGWAEVGTLAGNVAKEMLRAYRVGVVEPIQTILEARLRQTLFGPQGLNLRGKWRLEDLSWEETELNLKIATEGIQNGILTPNEARQLLGREVAEVDELDKFYMIPAIQPVTQQRIRQTVEELEKSEVATESVTESQDSDQDNQSDGNTD